jgi:hypothetical protein
MNAKKEMEAFVAGIDAWNHGRPRVPALDPILLQILNGLTDEVERLEVLAAWLVGWEQMENAKGVTA